MKVRSRVRIEDGIDDRGRAIGSAWPVAMAKTRSISNGFVVTAAADLPPRTSRSDLDPTAKFSLIGLTKVGGGGSEHTTEDRGIER